MITSAKKDQPSVNFTDKPIEVPDVLFLGVTGKLFQEDFKLADNGHYISIDHDWERYGKVEKFTANTYYYLKSFKGGRVGEIIPNPYSAFAQSNDLSLSTDKRGTRVCEYLLVGERVFNTYQTFLRTRNDIYFRQVERDILNGDRLT